MTVMRRVGSRARRNAAVAPAIPQPMIKTSLSAKMLFEFWPLVFGLRSCVNLNEFRIQHPRPKTKEHPNQNLTTELPNMQHPFDRKVRTPANLFIDYDLKLLFSQSFKCVL